MSAMPPPPVRERVAVVIGTRPEAIKMAPVVRALRASKSLQPFVIATSQHAGMTRGVFDSFGIEPDVDLGVMRPRQTLWELTSALVSALGGLFDGGGFHSVLVQGDTTSALAGGMCAFYHRIPVGHVEAGLRSHKRYSPFPEEMNRVLLGRLATWHFAPTDYSASLLRTENTPPESIFVCGNTVVDALQWMVRNLEDRPLPNGAADGSRRLVLVTCHRRENHGLPIRSVALAIHHMAGSRDDVHFLFPLHPSPLVREAVVPILSGQRRVSLCEPLAYDEFLSVLRRAHLVLSDSGGVQEEATALGKPVLVLRRETERPEGIAAGTLRLVGTEVHEIVRQVSLLLDDPDAHAAMTRGSSVYGDGTAAERIVSILEGNGAAGIPTAGARAAGDTKETTA